MVTRTPRINQERLWSELNELGGIGERPGQGLFRSALGQADMEARAWLADRMATAGLMVRVDEALNQIGRLPVKGASKVLALGSHLDTVPGGGRFDGALGVLAALECARVVRERGISLPWDLEVINFCDEEGAHQGGTVGSRAMLGLLHEEEIHKSRDGQAASFAQSISRLGGDPAAIGRARRDPGTLAGFLELHIEQGPFLEEAGLSIGAVSAIVGIHRYQVTVTGRAGHAGTTPMGQRRDALVDAAPFFSLLPAWVKKRGPQAVGTIGQLDLKPGAPNVIPETCRFMVELRSPKAEDLETLRRRLTDYAEKRAGWSVRAVYEKSPTPLSPAMASLVQKAAMAEGLAWVSLASGAGHDAQSFAAAGVDTALIFVPCREGASHCPAEAITPQAAGRGCQVLLNTVLLLAGP